MSSARSSTARTKLIAAGLFVGTSALAGVVVAAMALPAAGAVGGSAKAAVQAYDSLPADFTTPPLPRQTKVVASNGTEIATLYSENRIEVPLDSVAPVMQHAIVAIEDSRFFDHNGVDIKGTARALANNASGEDVQGASTLTMQYVKNVMLARADSKEAKNAATARSASRKLQEIRYAVELETQLSKAQILNNYLNISYFGAGAYGVEAASHRYFSKPANALNLVESATLAGIVQSPSVYDPTVDPAAAEKRRNTVLRKMFEQGFITQAEYEQAKATPIASYLNPETPKNGCASGTDPFFCDYAVRQVQNNPLFGATAEERQAFLANGGLIIKTTLDPKAQQAAQSAVNDKIPSTDESQKAAAIAMVQPGTGDIKAMAQNRVWGTNTPGSTTFNYAVDEKDGGTIGMQAGSTFKIFTIANAFAKNVNPFAKVDAKDKLFFPESDWGCPGQNYETFTGENSTQSGNFDMFQAAAYSTNTYFLKIEQMSGLCDTVKMAQAAGIHMANGKPLEPNIAFTLGTAEVSPLTVANAYATFAAHGVYCDPRAVDAVINREGQVITVPKTCQQTIAPDVADATTAVLSGVVDGPITGRTGSEMSLGRDTTGKTGTTDSHAAVWFAGYTPDLAAAVWVGDPRGGFQYPMSDVTVNGVYYKDVFGSSLPGPIWRQAMQGALSSTPATNFDLKAKYDLKPARQGGASDPRMEGAVNAFLEYQLTGSYHLITGSTTNTNNNTNNRNGSNNSQVTTTTKLVEPGEFSTNPVTFAEFSQYYFSHGGGYVPPTTGSDIYSNGSTGTTNTNNQNTNSNNP